jgi:hypothetical protein
MRCAPLPSPNDLYTLLAGWRMMTGLSSCSLGRDPQLDADY